MPTSNAIQTAQALDAYGFNVLPAPYKDRQPTIKWKQYQQRRTTKMLPVWFEGNTQRNWVIVTGRISNLIVLDTDSEASHAEWYERIGEEMDATCCVQTGKGKHYYFSLPDDDVVYPGRQSPHEGTDHWDIRGEGGIVAAPPSTHRSGRVYEWIREPEAMIPAPAFLLEVSRSLRAGPGDDTPDVSVAHGAPVRSMLSHLLAHPGEGGRNNWVTAVLGHYAKANRRMADLYEVEAERIWEMVRGLPAQDGSGEVYARSEFDKTVASVWSSEQRKGVGLEQAKEVGAVCGWLVGGDHLLMVQVGYKDPETKEWTIGYDEWADFDIVAHGVVEDDSAQRVYDVEIRRALHKDSRRALLKASTLADSKALAGWLAEYGVGIFPPDSMWPKRQDSSERLRRYLEAQKPPQFEVIDSLGWYEGSQGFVCHEGVIRADGLHGFEMHKPNPRLSGGWAPFRYGFERDWDCAREVLREVLTFHDDTVCSVFGSWWAACLLKPQIQEATSQFPFMALEAPSESGKTTGFFSMLLALGGNTLGNTNPTQAALRDYLSGNKSGIFWIDDLNDVQHLMELLRQATGDGAVSKKSEDKTSQAQIRLVNPICLSGEALPIRSQKALVDRAILLDVPSPTTRRSTRDPEMLQWQDIVLLRQKHPDLTVFSGWYVAHALALRDRVGQIAALVPGGSAGRWGDKMAVLRLGARLLAEMTGDEHHIARVDTWVEGEYDSGSENTLTLKVIPAALAQCNYPSAPQPPDDRHPATPAFVDKDGIVWFSPIHLAAWVYERSHGRIEVRTETADALTQQARALGLGGMKGADRRLFRLGAGTSKSIYWRLGDLLSELVVERAQGGRLSAPDTLPGLVPMAARDGYQTTTEGGARATERPLGVHPEQHRLDLLDLPMSPYPTDEGI